MKISFGELQRLARDPNTPEAELRKYFKAVPEAGGPFSPAIIPNPEFVDIEAPTEGFDSTEGAILLGMANGLSRTRRQAKFDLRIASGDTRPVLVAEGDSWFHFPIFLNDVVVDLFEHYNVWTVAAAGDTLQNMVIEAPEYMSELRRQKDRVKAFLFSGAGNDIVGEDANGKSVLLQILRPFQPGKPPEWYVNATALAAKLDFIESCYRKVIATVGNEFPQLPIVCHGYDYSIPGGQDGDPRHPAWAAQDKWIGHVFNDDLGITDGALQRAIIRILIDKLNDRIAKLCGANRPGGAFATAWHVDARNTMTSLALWADELHPTNEGFARVTRKFESVIAAALASANEDIASPSAAAFRATTAMVAAGAITIDIPLRITVSLGTPVVR
jgi:hypothetical protein